jgi:iron complex outermembrane recepter protein
MVRRLGALHMISCGRMYSQSALDSNRRELLCLPLDRLRRFGGVFGFLICLAITVQSQNLPQQTVDPTTLKKLSLVELSQIEVVTPSKEPEKAFNTPAAIYVITGEDIRRSGATSIPEALRLAPGVEVARLDSDKWSIGIRGFGSRLSRSVLVLIDGRTVYTTLLAGTYWEVQDTVLEDVDRIEIIRGPGGTIWGPNAVNGVINIITKSAKDTHGMLVSALGGNVDQGIVSFRYGGGKGDRLDYRVYAKAFSRGPEFHPDGRNFDDWRSGQGGFRLDWKRDDKNAFAFQGDLYDQRAGESVVATSYTVPYSQTLDANARLSGGNILGRWSRTVSEGNNFQLQAYYDRTNRRESNFGDLRDTFDIDFIHHIQVGSRNKFTWGAGTRFSRGHNLVVVSGLTFQPAQRTDRLLTAFFQDEVVLVKDRLVLTVGTKLLNTNFTDFEPEPSGRLLWTPTKKTSIWAAYTHAVRTPSDAERDFFLSGFIGLAPGGTPFFARFNANRNFRPEQMNGYELGVRRLVGEKFFVDVAGFFNHYHGLFSEDITGGPFLEDTPAPTHILLPAEFGNGLLGQTKGIEISPEWRPVSFWRLRGSYSYLHMNIWKAPNSLDIGSGPGIVGSSPEHQVTLDSAFDISKTLTLDLLYRYVSELPGQFLEGHPEQFVHGYSTADANFSWRLTRQLEFSITGRNLLQPHHNEFGTDPGALVGIKRSGYLKLTWTR